MNEIRFFEGDNRDSLRRLIDEGVRVQSIVCDPPYHLESVVKRFGKKGASPAKFGTDGAFARASSGFCGSKWDGADENGVRIAFDPAFWSLCLDILLPGGYCLAFSSARTGHRQACAMEDAGFIMHPFKGWVFGSGMPKAHNAAMAIDKSLGFEGSRGAPKSEAHAGWIERGRMRGGTDADNHEAWQRPWMDDETKVDAAARCYLPGSDEASRWDGWAYGSPMKPAIEPIYVAQKPISERTFAANLLKHGVGALNIAACRVGDNPATSRHPANLLHDGSAEVIALFPDSKGQLAKASSSSSSTRKNQNCYGEMKRGSDNPAEPRNDNGSAARFFNSFPTEADSWFDGTQREQGDSEGLECDPVMYHPKAGKLDRAGSVHPTVKPVALMQWLCRLATPPGGTVLDPFAGSGTTGVAALAEGFNCILMEAETQFAADIRRRFGDRIAYELDEEALAMIG